MKLDTSLLSAILSAVGCVTSFAIVYLSMPKLIIKLRKENIVGRDMLKREEVHVPESAGMIIVLAVVASLSFVTYLYTVYAIEGTTREKMHIAMLSAIAAILAVGFIGLMDDYLNMPQKYKVILPAFASLPLAFAFISRTTLWVPLVGRVPTGVLGPLLLIPIGTTAAANLTNMYGGLNGLEAGSGLIACCFTALAAMIIGRWEAVIILAPMIGAVAAFLPYNRYPAKAFPGDVGTLAIGGSLAVASIVGAIKIIAVIALMPQIINFFQYLFKIRFFMANPSAKFASVREDGTLKAPEGAEYGSLYFLMMHLYRRDERWHVRVHWAICFASGLAALILGILVYKWGFLV